jgi:hypothetical protein
LRDYHVLTKVRAGRNNSMKKPYITIAFEESKDTLTITRKQAVVLIARLFVILMPGSKKKKH